MEQQLGCQQVSLVGLRMGATLAMLATEHQEVENLVLWSPVLKGRAYVREMKALSMTADAALGPPDAAADKIEAAGFALSNETAEELSRVDLLQSNPRCRNALVVARDDVSRDARLLDRLSSLGIQAEQIAPARLSRNDGRAARHAGPLQRHWLHHRLASIERHGESPQRC